MKTLCLFKKIILIGLHLHARRPGPHWPTEDHINGDISLAFQQYYATTANKTWLRDGGGFAVIEGIARFWASKATRNSDGSYSIPQTQSPDEYHTNVTDAVYTNLVARLSLLGAHALASTAGAAPNTTFKNIADSLRIPYDAARDINPEYEGYDLDAYPTIKQADVVLADYPLQV